MDLDLEIKKLENKILTLETENNQSERQIAELNTENAIYEQTIQDSLDGVALIENISVRKRMTVKMKIEKVVTEALKNIYGMEYTVHFDYETKNNRTCAEIYLVKENVKRTMDGFGGGVSDVISLPLKLLVLHSMKGCSKILIADEPGKHIDSLRVQKFFQFISYVSKKMKTQVILCSHHNCAKDYADNKYELRLDKGRTHTKKC